VGDFYILAVLTLYLASGITKPAPQPIFSSGCIKQRSVQGQEQAVLLNLTQPRNKSCSSDADSPTHTHSSYRGFGIYSLGWPGLTMDSKCTYVINQQAGSWLSKRTRFSSLPINLVLAEITACLSTLWPQCTSYLLPGKLDPNRWHTQGQPQHLAAAAAPPTHALQTPRCVADMTTDARLGAAAAALHFSGKSNARRWCPATGSYLGSP